MEIVEEVDEDGSGTIDFDGEYDLKKNRNSSLKIREINVQSPASNVYNIVNSFFGLFRTLQSSWR